MKFNRLLIIILISLVIPLIVAIPNDNPSPIDFKYLPNINVNNSQYLEGYSVNSLYNYYKSFFDNLYCKLTGCTMQGNINMNNNDIDNIKNLNVTGNATINNLSIGNNGNLILTGSARVRKNVEIAIGSMKPPSTNPADWSDLGIAGAWSFADNKISTVILEMPLPLDIDRTEDVVVDITWASPSTTGDCVWELSYLMRSENEPINAGADDTLNQIVAPSGTSYGLVSTSFTIPSADISDTDKLLILKLERIGNDANDDLGDVAYLTAMNFNYVSNKLGESLI